MMRGLFNLLTVLALAGTLLPQAPCLGFGQACCCGGRGDAASGDLLASDGCGCRGPQVASCSPDPKPATAAAERLAPRLELVSADLLAGVPALAAPAGTPGIAIASAPPTPPTPLSTLLCRLRI